MVIATETIMDESLLQAVRSLLEPTARVTGVEFFRGLAKGLAKSLGVKAGFVGTLVPDRHAILTSAVWWDDGFIDNFEYALEGTPCARVIGHEACFFPERVQELFPNDEMLVQMGIHSYMGVPINGGAGTPLGILVALHSAPTPRFAGRAREQFDPIFQLFADRAGLEFERLAAHQRLHASEARYRHIVSSTRDGVWLIDAAARTTFVNPQMASMLGWEPEDMIGRPLYDFMSVDRRTLANTNLDRRARGISERHEFCFMRKDGSELWTILSTTALMDDAGKHAGSLALVADLSEVRLLEQKIVQSQKLESLGLLAGGVAHDFNNLLVGILGNVGLALAESAPGSELRDVLTSAEAACRRAADLTRQMLAYSGRGRFIIERVGLNQVVEELATLLGSVVSKSAQLCLELADELPEIEADATQIRQIVMNLITNASDALEGKPGVISIITGEVAADEAYLASTVLDDRLPAGNYVYVEVRDTGVGMTAETRGRIFDPFFTTKFTGRGLGLAAVLGILRGHHGAVSVDSELGKGTTIRILFPRATPAPTKTAEPAPSKPEPRTVAGVVLVADDEPVIRRLAQRVLEARGYRVLLAEDGTQAVSMFRDHAADIDVVVVDLTMPGLNGDEVLRQIRRIRPTARIVLSSGYDAHRVMATLGGEGSVGFLSKPWSPQDLLQAMNAALESG